MHNLNQFDGGIKKNEKFRVSIQKSCYEKSYILDSTLWQIGKKENCMLRVLMCQKRQKLFL